MVSTNGAGLVELVDDEGTVFAQAVYCPPTGGQGRAMFQICVRPTIDPVVAGLPGKWPAPHGLWRLSVAARGLARTAEIHAWIQRDDVSRRSTLVARQSRFVDEHYQEVDDNGFPVDVDNPLAVVKRQGSLNAIATGRKTIVVGAGDEHVDMTRHWPSMALYSGGGSGAGPGVDVVAPVEEFVVLFGMLGAGTRSSARVRMNGTSVAAPAAVKDIATENHTVSRRFRQIPCARVGRSRETRKGACSRPPQGVWPPETVRRGQRRHADTRPEGAAEERREEART